MLRGETAGSPGSSGDGFVFDGTIHAPHRCALLALAAGGRIALVTTRMVRSSVTVADGMAYVGSGDGCLYALDAATGSERWRLAANGVVYVGNDDGAVCGIRGGPASLRRAVFWDSALVRASRITTRRELRDYLSARGYDVLGTEGHRAFLSARVADRAPSVVVLSLDHLPASVAPVAADTVLFRRYLDAGGKVVWPGIPPFIWPRDPGTGEGAEYGRIDRAGHDSPARSGSRPCQLRRLRRETDRSRSSVGTLTAALGRPEARRRT